MTAISKIDHIAIVVKSISEVRSFYEDVLGLKISSTETMPERGITTAFICVGDTKIELIEPLNNESEVSKFLEKRGPGIHHIAFKCNDVKEMSSQMKNNNVNLVYSEPQKGAHGTFVNFIHPKSSFGPLMEIVE